jgi:hypothetical protein
MRKLLITTGVVCAVLLAAAPVGAGEAEDQEIADDAVLTLADLPDGWEEDERGEELPTTTSECRRIQRVDDKAEDVANAKSPEFDDGNDPNAVASVSNDVFVYPKVKGAKRHLAPFKRDGLDCLTSIADEAGFEYTIDELDIEDAGDDGIGFRIEIQADNGFVNAVDLIIVRVGRATATFNAEAETPGLTELPDAVEVVVERLEEAQ